VEWLARTYSQRRSYSHSTTRSLMRPATHTSGQMDGLLC